MICTFDIETTGFDPLRGDILICATLKPENKPPIIYVHQHPDKEEYLKDPLDKIQNENNRNRIWAYLNDPDVTILGHNIAFDIKFWYLFFGVLKPGYLSPNFKCTMVGYSLLDPTGNSELGNIANILLGKKKEDIDNTKLWTTPLDEVIYYNYKDVKLTYEVYDVLTAILREEGQSKIYSYICKALRVFIQMQIRGVNIDEEYLKDLIGQLISLKDKIHNNELVPYAGDINFRSWQQLGNVIYTKKKWPIIKMNKSGPATGADVIKRLLLSKQLKKKDKEFARNLLLYRSLEKQIGTYVGPLLEKHSVDGVIRTKYNLCKTIDGGTVSGRSSSSKPNLQNVSRTFNIEYPIGTDTLVNIRKAFIPDKGTLFFKCDYAQIELRLAGWLSKDPVFQESFRSGRDLHSYTCSKLFDLPYDELITILGGSDLYTEADRLEWKKKRHTAKTFNFAMLYGAYPNRLQATLLNESDIWLPLEEVKEIRLRWIELYTHYVKWQSRVHNIINVYGQVVSETGRKRELFNPKDGMPPWIKLSGYHREGLNHLIQSLAADLTFISMVNLDEFFRRNRQLKGEVVFNVHDSVDGIYIHKDNKDLVHNMFQQAIHESFIVIPKNILKEEFNLSVDDLYIDVDYSLEEKTWG